MSLVSRLARSNRVRLTQSGLITGHCRFQECAIFGLFLHPNRILPSDPHTAIGVMADLKSFAYHRLQFQVGLLSTALRTLFPIIKTAALCSQHSHNIPTYQFPNSQFPNSPISQPPNFPTYQSPTSQHPKFTPHQPAHLRDTLLMKGQPMPIHTATAQASPNIASAMLVQGTANYSISQAGYPHMQGFPKV